MRRIQCKRFTVAVMLCMLLTLLCVFPVGAATAPTVTVGGGTMERGGTLDVALSLDSNSGIWGTRLKVDYDHKNLTLKSYKVGDVFTAEEVTAPQNLEKESYIFLADRSEFTNTTKNGVLVTLSFAVKNDAELKEYPITVSALDVIDADGKKVELTCVPGTLKTVNCLHDGNTNGENALGEIRCSECGEIIKEGTGSESSKPEESSKPGSEVSKPSSGGTSESSSTGAIVPDTGDNNPIGVYIGLILLSGSVVLVVFVRQRKQQKEK